MALEYYLDRFQNLKMNNAGGKKSPHKVCMLLAVMGIFRPIRSTLIKPLKNGLLITLIT